ncbi:hypothetical protein EZJ43_08220 [Pedobacter changchengzhani]|uniref:PqqD family protein n=1 Tax=Pedobacter changchengzhani TaxID=2529274 RepID=A0A4V3A079_9SPHI|nr:hypothetical protein EZJ43_08220 [Pedobacter changchengzhani]
MNPRLAADIFDGEYIIANLDTGLYYSIQGLAVSMVNALPFDDEKEVIMDLATAFPEHTAIIENELNIIFSELQNESIIKLNAMPADAKSKLLLPEKYVISHFNRYADMQDLLMLDPIHDVDEEGWTVQNDQK